jgi:RNA polymerase sigma factor (sigma-70 family)
MATASEPEVALVQRALGGDGRAVRALVDQLTPVIQARVARGLVRRSRAAAGRNVRQEVEDFVQEVMISLFAENGRALRAWDPRRGLSLNNFVGFLAERQIITILRTAKRSPWTEDPTLEGDLEGPMGSDDHLAAALESQQVWELVLDRLTERLSPLGAALFEAVWLNERSVTEAAEQFSMSRDAVYAWQSRLGKALRVVATEVMSEAGAPPRKAKVGGSE